jgi:hypothetical protein
VGESTELQFLKQSHMTADIPLYQYVIFVRLLNSAQIPPSASRSCLNVQRGQFLFGGFIEFGHAGGNVTLRIIIRQIVYIWSVAPPIAGVILSDEMNTAEL